MVPAFDCLSGFGAPRLPHCHVHTQPLLQVAPPPALTHSPNMLPSFIFFRVCTSPRCIHGALVQLDRRLCVPLLSCQRPHQPKRRQKLYDHVALRVHVRDQQLRHEGRQQLGVLLKMRNTALVAVLVLCLRKRPARNEQPAEVAHDRDLLESCMARCFAFKFLCAAGLVARRCV